MDLKYIKATAAAIAISISGFANAGLIIGDFRTESNLPELRTGSPLVYQSLAQSIGAGYELDGTDLFENPDGWGGGEVWLDYDVSTGILLLDSQDEWDFNTFDAFINNISFDIAGEHITDITMLTNDLVNDGTIPVLSFTDNSIQVSYTGSFDFTGRSATFQITTSIPEPSTLAIFALGIIGLAARRFKKQ